MNPLSGGFRIFRLFGINVFVHWTWLLVAVYEIQFRQSQYSSVLWNAAEYLALFMIVLMHEFGHSLACRSVGGEANRILLWPLGGAAFVKPPQRPGATLWSIVAGPLVNVVLIPVTCALAWRFHSGPLSVPMPSEAPNLDKFLVALCLINVLLLVFNMLPVYPLDGGQILRSLMWFIIGPAKSLLVASMIGFGAAAVGLVLAAVVLRSPWLSIMAIFAAMQSWQAMKRARSMAQILALPRHPQARCPSCGQNPPAVPTLRCACGQPVDPFVTGACPNCGQLVDRAGCVHCGEIAPLPLWTGAMYAPVPPAAPPPGVAGHAVQPG
jgi:Zn-dependent protease